MRVDSPAGGRRGRAEVGQAASLPAAPAGAKSVAKVTPAGGWRAAGPTLAGSWRACSRRLLRSGGAWLLGLVAGAGLAWAQGTAFSYQGQLTDGAAVANGTYDLRFTLWNAATGGAPQGTTLTQSGVGVTNGLFTATLDFGAQFTGANRWLEIAVRTNGAADFTTLAERQPVLPTPYAIHAATAGSAATATTATTVTGPIPAAQLTGSLSAAQIPNLDASKITGGTFTGNGGGLTNVPLDALVRSTTSVVAWGWDSADLKPPVGLSDVVALSGGTSHVLALRSDGSVVAWGDDYVGRATPPVGLTNVVKLSAGAIHSLALKSDGTVVAWGGNGSGQASVPVGLVGVTSIAAGERFSLALKSDGTVVGWGGFLSLRDTRPIPIPANLSGVIAIAAGMEHWLAAKADGGVGEWDIFGGARSVPDGLTNVVAVAAGAYHSLALKADGTVVAWGDDSSGQTSVPTGLTDVVSVCGGMWHSLALKSDGTVVGWGETGFTQFSFGGQSAVPAGATTVTAIAATAYSSFALRTNPIVAAEVALLSQNNAFEGNISALGFFGSGSGLTSLNAAALSSGAVPVDRIPDLDAGKVTSGTFATARIPDLDAGKITTGTLAAARIPSLDASKVTTGTFATAQIPNLDATKIMTGTLAAAQIPNLDAGKITTGTVADGRLSANVARLDGSPVFSSDVRLGDHDLFLRGGTDSNHGLGWFGGGGRTFAGATVDGPVLYGFLGGALGSTKTAQRIALSWNDSADVTLGGDLTITNTLSVTSPSGIRAASFTGARTGNFSSAVVQVENTSTSGTASPALRVLGRGSSVDGALNVSADTGRIARFGNATDWVAAMDNAGNFAATSFVTLSDRTKKAGFAPVDVEAVLAKVAALPLTTWHYTNDAAATPHLGPMAQDFHAAFGLGGDDKTITTVDADGVALAAIQGLHHRTTALAAENAVIREELARQQTANADLRDELGELRSLVRQLQQQLNANRP